MRFLSFAIFFYLAVAAPSVGQTTDDKPQVLFINCHIFDGSSETLIKNGRVLVEGNLIKSVGGASLKAAKRATVIDCGGKILMPGLIDMHWHSAYANIPMQLGLNSDHAYHLLIGAKGNTDALLRGFTTVRDVGGNVFSLAKLTDAGVYMGPRIFPSGPAISQTSGHTDFRPATAVPADSTMPLIYMERGLVT